MLNILLYILAVYTWGKKFLKHHTKTAVHHHHHKHHGLDPLIRSVSRVTAARANASSVFQLFSFLVVRSGMISKGFSFVWHSLQLMTFIVAAEHKLLFLKK
jgi:hypothetical protein